MAECVLWPDDLQHNHTPGLADPENIENIWTYNVLTRANVVDDPKDKLVRLVPERTMPEELAHIVVGLDVAQYHAKHFIRQIMNCGSRLRSHIGEVLALLWAQECSSG